MPKSRNFALRLYDVFCSQQQMSGLESAMARVNICHKIVIQVSRASIQWLEFALMHNEEIYNC